MEKDEEEDDGHLFTKVLENNDRTVNSDLVEEQPSGVLNIANNLESVETSNNVARVDEYDYDSSDEEVGFGFSLFSLLVNQYLCRTCSTRSATYPTSGTKTMFTLAMTCMEGRL